MSVHKTCLIVGAGGSVPYGLPSGADLRNLLVLLPSEPAKRTAVRFPVWNMTDRRFFDVRAGQLITLHKQERSAVQAWEGYLESQFLASGFKSSEGQAFRQRFFNGKSRSIDRFLQFYEPQFGDIGRAAIAAVILNCEQDRCLDVDWYEELLDQIAPTPEALKPGSLSVVTFNYDRSFERYFSTALASQFNLDAEAAAELFQRIEIEHVYGSLGPLEKIPYGEIDSVKDAAKQIDLMRAGANHARAKRINELIAAASNVCFLGFSFADENLALFKQGSFAKKNVLVATALGLPQKRMAAAKRLIPRIKFHDMSILTLLNQEDVFRAPKTARITPSSPTRPKRSTWAGGGTFWSA